MTYARLRLVARVGTRRSPYSWFVVGSALVHGAVVVALIVVPSLRRRPPVYDNPLIVELAAPAAKRPPSPPKAAPLPAAPAQKPEGVRVETKQPEPAKTPPEPEPRETPPPDPVPSPPVAEEDPAPASGVASAEATGDSGGQIAPLEGGDLEFAWYRTSVTAQLFSHWRRPLLSGFREPFEVAIAFEILRDGRIANARIEQSSGVPSLDRSALRAVSDAAPLPPLPANWEEPTLSAGFVFRLYPDD